MGLNGYESVKQHSMRLFFSLLWWFCFASNVSAQCSLTATSSGSRAGYTQVYVLVDANGRVVDQNATGTFANVSPGVYQVHALNYDPANPPAPLPSDLVGQAVLLVGTVAPGCFNSDFLSDFVVRVCDACSRTTTICETDPLVVSSSGNNPDYIQRYVLVDASTGLVLTSNATGIFTGSVTAGTSYQVYALNYNPADAPAPLPTPGQPVTAIGTTTAGCYNSDFLTDYLCFNITTCTPPCAKTIEVCPNASIVATSSGNNGSYTQCYVLADEAGHFLAASSSGTFSSIGLTMGATYRVHALNYNPSNPPTPLPTAMAVGADLSSLAGGCYNSDFLDDYVCVDITCPILLDGDVIELRGWTRGADNELSWTKAQEQGILSYRLERSGNAVDFQPIYHTTPGSVSYDFWDAQPLPLSYYRLRIQLQNGTTQYSNIVALEHEIEQTSAFEVYPNPSQDGQFTLAFIQTDARDWNVRVWDVQGREVRRFDYSATAGQNQIALDLMDCASGVYVVGIQSFNQQLIRKIVRL